jgi:hypothetical protein
MKNRQSNKSSSQLENTASKFIDEEQPLQDDTEGQAHFGMPYEWMASNLENNMKKKLEELRNTINTIKEGVIDTADGVADGNDTCSSLRLKLQEAHTVIAEQDALLQASINGFNGSNSRRDSVDSNLSLNENDSDFKYKSGPSVGMFSSPKRTTGAYRVVKSSIKKAPASIERSPLSLKDLNDMDLLLGPATPATHKLLKGIMERQ